MKFCMPHWTALREEIENKQGLGQFVSNGGKDLVSRITESGADPLGGETGDPLMDAHNLILGNAMNLLSNAGINPLEMLVGDLCPLCFVSKCGNPECQCGAEQRSTKWIEFAGRDIAALWADRLKAVTQ